MLPRTLPLALAGWLLTACRDDCDCPEPTEEPPVDTDLPDTTPLPAEEPCPATSWISWTGGDCQDLLTDGLAETWSTWPLLLGPGEPTREELLEFLELPGHLRGYCELVPVDEAAPPLPAGLADPDCGVVAPLATAAEVSAQVLQPLREAWRSAAGGPVAVPVSGPPVRVAVVDTQVTSPAARVDDAADQARHGCAMRTFIQDLTCAGDCPAEITSLLALDRVPGSPPTQDTTRGGFYGTQGTLARRIAQALGTWQRDGQPGPLIVHLAVGWEARYNSPPGSPGGWSWAALAVRDAIEHATCSGALVIAAAGNETGGTPVAVGPMYPAGWEAQAVTCLGSPAPLLAAVDAVGPDGALVLRARPRATPRLVAPGAQAMADVATWAPGCGVDGAPVTALTGSSVATAVTAAAAASVWQVRPELNAQEVVQVLWSSGTPPTGPAPDGGWVSAFGLAPGTPVRQVSVCRAVAQACEEIGADCAPECPALRPWDGKPDPDANEVIPADTLDLLPDCGSGPCAHDAWVNSFLVPAAVVPTPSTDGCTECWLNAAGLHLVLNPELRTPLLEPRLVWFDSLGRRLGSHDLSVLPRGSGTLADGLRAGEVIDITGLAVPAAAARGRLDVRVRFGAADRSMASEVWVDR